MHLNWDAISHFNPNSPDPFGRARHSRFPITGIMVVQTILLARSRTYHSPCMRFASTRLTAA
jgi:hypothetical protein